MAVVEQDAPAPPSQVQALEEAFALFCKQTEQLQEAYAGLKQKAERINLELEEANRELEQRVRELDEAHNFQSSILESIPTAVVVTDLSGTVRTFNAAAERMWGVPREEALGRSFHRVLGEHAGLLADVLAGRCRRESVRRELAGPELRTISSTACLVEDSAGRPIGAVQADQDLTRLSELEARVRQQEKLADLGKMAAGLAHEIRKPLNGIKGFASILERKLDCDSAQRRYIGNIMAAADRLNGMLGRLLDFARPDELKLTRCDLRAEAEEVAEFVRAEGLEDGVHLIVSMPDEARVVLADPHKVKQVLLNLVKNGVEALAGPGRVVVSARLEAADGEPQVTVEVADTGRGIAPERLARIFEPFSSDKDGGTGLGLAIVSRILQLHGTRLDVRSRPGEGTAMAFSLPLARSAEER